MSGIDMETARANAVAELKKAVGWANEAAAEAPSALGVNVRYETTDVEEAGKPDGQFLRVRTTVDV